MYEWKNEKFNNAKIDLKLIANYECNYIEINANFVNEENQ